MTCLAMKAGVSEQVKTGLGNCTNHSVKMVSTLHHYWQQRVQKWRDLSPKTLGAKLGCKGAEISRYISRNFYMETSVKEFCIFLMKKDSNNLCHMNLQT